MKLIEAQYEDGLLKPCEPLPLRPGERVRLIVVHAGEPARWDLSRFAAKVRDEDLRLAEQGLGEWADALDEEDRR